MRALSGLWIDGLRNIPCPCCASACTFASISMHSLILDYWIELITIIAIKFYRQPLILYAPGEKEKKIKNKNKNKKEECHSTIVNRTYTPKWV